MDRFVTDIFALWVVSGFVAKVGVACCRCSYLGRGYIFTP